MNRVSVFVLLAHERKDKKLVYYVNIYSVSGQVLNYIQNTIHIKQVATPLYYKISVFRFFIRLAL